MLWKCCKNIMDVAFFFLIPPQISATIIYLFFPYFGNGIAAISLSQFFFSFHFGHSTHTSYPSSRNWAKEFRYSHYRNSTFSLSPFFFFSLLLFVEFRQWWYRNSLSFLTILNNFNSSYNANKVQILNINPRDSL